MPSRQRYIKICRKLAKKSTMSARHGSILVKNNKIIGKGYNFNYNNMCHGHWSVHAEVACIKDAIQRYGKNRIKGATLYVVRISGDIHGNVLRDSKPCENCSKCIIKYGIVLAYYSNNGETLLSDTEMLRINRRR